MFSFLKKEISIYVDKERRKGIFEIYKMNTLLLKSQKNSEIKTFMSHHELSGLYIQSYQPVLWLRAPESQMRPGSREHGTSRHPCSSLQVTWSQPSQFLTVHWEIRKNLQILEQATELSRTDEQRILSPRPAVGWDQKDSKPKEWKRKASLGTTAQLWAPSVSEIHGKRLT